MLSASLHELRRMSLKLKTVTKAVAVSSWKMRSSGSTIDPKQKIICNFLRENINIKS